jgi:hypothetical protein
MKLILALAVVVVVAAFAAPAEARQSRWCADYGDGHGGVNCGFSTYAQCRAAISGFNTGTCVRNYSSRYYVYR